MTSLKSKSESLCLLCFDASTARRPRSRPRWLPMASKARDDLALFSVSSFPCAAQQDQISNGLACLEGTSSSRHVRLLSLHFEPPSCWLQGPPAFAHFWVYAQRARSLNSKPKRQAGWLFWQGAWSTVVLRCFVNDHRCWYITLWQRNSRLYGLLAFR